MIKIDKAEVFGWEAAIRGMRNPKNSWEKSDSVFFDGDTWHDICGQANLLDEHQEGIDLGLEDHGLMMRLANGGPVHAKYRRMIVVYTDILAPLYWWKEFDTYKVGTVANSCSTMHKIQAKEFVREDFSHEHFDDVCHASGDGYQIDLETTIEDALGLEYNGGLHLSSFGVLDITISMLNKARKKFLETNDKRYWWQMIQLLPSSYNQKRTVMLNYEVLAGIYPMRKNHKLDEWHDFCRWIENLPYSEIITGEKPALREGGNEAGASSLAPAT